VADSRATSGTQPSVAGVALHLELSGSGLRAGLMDALREAGRSGRLVSGTRLPRPDPLPSLHVHGNANVLTPDRGTSTLAQDQRPQLHGGDLHLRRRPAAGHPFDPLPIAASRLAGSPTLES
jgi:methylmalonyl-CoA mutase cobalamin-binding subunit